MDREPEDKNQIAFIILLFGVILVLGALLLFQMQDKSSESGEIFVGLNKKIRTKEYEKSVNAHLSEVYSKSQLKQKTIDLQNKKEAPLISKTNEEATYPYREDLTLDGENLGDLIGKDLNGIRKKNFFDTPEQKVRDDMIRDQQEAFQKLKDKEAYARQFIENARQDGYEVTLDSEYHIVDIKRIKKPRYPSLFEGGEFESGTGGSR
jgi:hypothetical protein